MNGPGKFLELEGVTFRYAGRVALDVPSFSLEQGKVTALLGPNGSGKTTLLSLLDLLVTPSEGRLILDGVPVPADEPSRRRLRLGMSLLLQEPYLFKTTVAGNVAWGLRARDLPEAEVQEKTSWALDLVGLGGFGPRDARKLSGGEAQRVALARALATGPRLLLLDEPTASIDPQSVVTLESVIARINREEGMTVVLATHNFEQAYRLADRVYTLFEGSLIASPMDNLYRGSVVRENGACFFETARVRMQCLVARGDENKTHALLNPEDIILSRAPFDSSARNVMRGKVSLIAHRGGAVRVDVEAGERFCVSITEESLRSLGLELGAELYLTFKASSVRLL